MVKRPPRLRPLLGSSVRNENQKAVTILPQEAVEKAGGGDEPDEGAAAAATPGKPVAPSPGASSQGSSQAAPSSSAVSALSGTTSPDPEKARRGTAPRIEYDDPRKELGRGEYGIVYLGYVNITGPHGKSVRKPVAVKEVVLREDQPNRELDITNELRERRHDHIIKVYETLMKHNILHVVMEYMDEGTLKGVLERVRRADAASAPGTAVSPKGAPTRQLVSDSVVAALAVQVLSAVNFLHSSRRTLHRDIKPENLLLNHKGYVKLSDFGFAKECRTTGGQASTFVGTGIYMSPTRMEGQKYGPEEDVWSMGVVLCEIACGVFPFPRIIAKDIGWLDAVEEARTFSQTMRTFGLSPDLLDYLSKFLDPDGRNRGSAISLLNHPFIQKHVRPPVPSGTPAQSVRESVKVSRVRKWLDQLRTAGVAVKHAS